MRPGLALATASLALGACVQTVPFFASPGTGGTGLTGKGGSGGGSGNVDGGGPDGSHCFVQPLMFTSDTPQMVIALDRSSNMNQPFGPDTQLAEATHSLQSEVSGYGPSPNGGHPQQDRPYIAFSFLDFPDNGSSCPSTPECCARDAVATPSPTSFNTALYQCQSSPCVMSANRPVATALSNAIQSLKGTPGSNNPRYVLLITDGQPGTTCQSDECGAAITQAGMMRDSIHLLVAQIGPGDQNGAPCLPSLADAANGINSSLTPPFFQQALGSSDVTTVISNAMSYALCSGTVANPSSSGNSNLQVWIGQGIGGMPISNSSDNGWTSEPGSSRIRFHGAACSLYLQFGGNVQVYPSCSHSTSGGPSSP
jgi:hypothetical protein